MFQPVQQVEGHNGFFHSAGEVRAVEMVQRPLQSVCDEPAGLIIAMGAADADDQDLKRGGHQVVVRGAECSIRSRRKCVEQLMQGS